MGNFFNSALATIMENFFNGFLAAVWAFILYADLNGRVTFIGKWNNDTRVGKVTIAVMSVAFILIFLLPIFRK